LVKRVAAGVTGVALAASFERCTTTQAREGAAREPTGVTAAEGAAASSTSTSAVAGSGASEESTALAPLEGELVRLPVAGFNDAIVSVPTGAKAPRPVVLALHGNFDRPEWQCEVWRGVTKARAFVVCPRGIPRPDAPRSLDRWTYGKGTAVRAEVEAALGAVRARFENYVASGPILYAGFSLGAIHGVGIVASDGQRYRRAVLVEGGHDGWTAERAKAYAAAGGERVLFACGQRACKTDAAQARKNLERAGIRTELVYGGEVGHTYDGPVASEIARVWTWLVADDPRWTDG
jgi:predicted esterase